MIEDEKDKLVEDHPHIHGEHFQMIWISSGALGSPPHTWGTLY